MYASARIGGMKLSLMLMEEGGVFPTTLSLGDSSYHYPAGQPRLFSFHGPDKTMKDKRVSTTMAQSPSMKMSS